MNIHDVIEIQGNLFQVKRKIPEDQIKLEKGNINDLKIFFHCDTIFKAQGYFWIVNKIKEISYEETE
tara:strand:- start:252 stop:452 length:201 start_codon:yes stop_codon:yes gene_type:complete